MWRVERYDGWETVDLEWAVILFTAGFKVSLVDSEELIYVPLRVHKNELTIA